MILKLALIALVCTYKENEIKKLFIILIMLVPMLANSAPVNFVDILNKYAVKSGRLYAYDKYTFYTTRHIILGAKPLPYAEPEITPAEAKTIVKFYRNYNKYNLANKAKLTAAESETVLANARELNTSIGKIKTIGEGGFNTGISRSHLTTPPEEIYAIGRSNGAAIVEGNYITAHGAPIVFSENSGYIAQNLGRHMYMEKVFDTPVAKTIGKPVMYIVKNPLRVTPVASVGRYDVASPAHIIPGGSTEINMAEEAPMLYNYGSSLKVTKVTTKTLTAGRYAGHTYIEVELMEVPKTNTGSTIYSLGEGSALIRVTPNEIIYSDIPIEMRVKLTGPIYKDVAVGPDGASETHVVDAEELNATQGFRRRSSSCCLP